MRAWCLCVRHWGGWVLQPEEEAATPGSLRVLLLAQAIHAGPCVHEEGQGTQMLILDAVVDEEEGGGPNWQDGCKKSALLLFSTSPPPPTPLAPSPCLPPPLPLTKHKDTNK